MPTPIASVALLATVALATAASACGDRSANPSPGAPGSVTPFVQSLVILGPEALGPGVSAQYTVELRLSDGSIRKATDVTWRSSVPTVLQIDALGTATGGSTWGEATVTAAVRLARLSNSDRLVTREILVQPAGTFRLVGLVTDADAPSLGIPLARLEVRESLDVATPIVTAATTDGQGAYRLYGVPASAYLRIRKDGYEATTHPVQLEAHGSQNFSIRLEGTNLSLAGAYTMTVEATRCTFTPLPPELRQRTYGAMISQSGAVVSVRLSEAVFHVTAGSGDGFTGMATPSGVDVEITGFYDFYYYPHYPSHPALTEILSDGTALVVNGRGTLSGTRERLSGTLSGGVTQYAAPTFPSVRYLTGCYGGTVVTLTRR